MEKLMATPAAASERGQERAYYNISQAAALLGVSRVSVWRWIRDGALEATRLGHRTTRIRHEELEDMLLRLRGGRAAEAGAAAGEHFVQFYERDEYLVEALAEFIGKGLRSREGAIVVATQAHRTALDWQLRASGI